MKKAVFDASIAAKWFVEDAKSDQAIRYRLDYDQIAPGLILVEVANVLLRYVRVGEFPAEAVTQAVRNVEQTVVTTGDQQLISEATELAHKAAHSIYDMLYVALALRSGLPLVTADLKLAGKLKAAQIPVQLLTLETP